jgi:AraC family transcriptional regulator
MPLLPPTATDWQKLAEIFTFLFDQTSSGTAYDLTSKARGDLVWICPDGETAGATVPARPALIVHTAHGSSPSHTEIIPHLSASDPLLHHIVLVLKAAVDAQTADARLFAHSLADALATHFVRRYVPARQTAGRFNGGLLPYKLRRVIVYINGALDQELSLSGLAAVAQMSVAHFARLFKQATGSTPHHYILIRRIERAKRLLTESELPLSEVGQRVGLADQSHFTAVFRKYVGTTPRAHRDAMS